MDQTTGSTELDSTAELTEPYNYPSFPSQTDVADFQRFPEIVKVGTHAPDPVLTELDTGERVQLSELTKQGITILEFGSLT